MRAFVLPSFESAPEIQELETPQPAEGEVLVRVRSASVNGFDLAVANGYLNGMMEHRFPVVLGKDFAGVVEALGEGVTEYAVGDRVFGVVTKPFLGDGSLGEYVTVPVGVGVARIPDDMDFSLAGALGLAGTAAIDSFDAAQIAAGQVVLVAGATGGVGSLVVQFAKSAGATVIATAHSDAERQQVTELGADEVVDYTEDVAAQVRSTHPDGIDVVVHLAGDGAALAPLVRAGGRLVSTLLGSPDQVDGGEATVVPIMATPTAATLDRLSAAVTTGDATIVVERSYAFDAVTDAFADFSKGTLGKLVVELA
jgi:NADPH:quinone reductase-like Zn-dependent oxidoreductase